MAEFFFFFLGRIFIFSECTHLTMPPKKLLDQIFYFGPRLGIRGPNWPFFGHVSAILCLHCTTGYQVVLKSAARGVEDLAGGSNRYLWRIVGSVFFNAFS